MTNPKKIIAHIWSYRYLLFQLVRRNIEVRYRGTMVGIMWAAITPIVILIVYTFVFGVILNVDWGGRFGDSKIGFALILFSGISVFNIFSESLSASAVVIRGNVSYVKKTIFPLEILPVSSVLSSFFFGLIWLLILMAAMVTFFRHLCLSVAALPLLLAPLFFFSCGLSWIVSSMGVFLSDMPHAVSVALLVLKFMTPIFYSIDMVPSYLRWVFILNPVSFMVVATRQALIFGQWPDWNMFFIILIFSLVVFQGGYFLFMKTKQDFSDML